MLVKIENPNQQLSSGTVLWITSNIKVFKGDKRFKKSANFLDYDSKFVGFMHEISPDVSIRKTLLETLKTTNIRWTNLFWLCYQK